MKSNFSKRIVVLANLLLVALVFSLALSPQDVCASPLDNFGDDVQIDLIGVGKINGRVRDRTGLSEKLEDGTPHNQFGGISGTDYCPKSEIYFGLSDRGAKDGAVDYLCRFHELKIDIDPHHEDPVKVKIVNSILIKNQSALPYPGASNAIYETPERARRLDPEGIRIDSNQKIWISDEYGPYLMQFDREGNFVQELPVPNNLLIKYPSPSSSEEDARNQTGRRSNRGMEGIALTPSGRFLVGIMQSPLLQDSYPSDKEKPIGFNARIICFDLEDGTTSQHVYRQERDKNKMHEILAIDEHRFLVIEQDGKPGAESKMKSIFQINMKKATDVSDVASLADKKLPKGIKPVKKKLFLDLLDDRFGLASTMPEKVEGLCFGPTLPDGRKTLIVVTDNDFRSNEPTMFYVFAF